MIVPDRVPSHYSDRDDPAGDPGRCRGCDPLDSSVHSAYYLCNDYPLQEKLAAEEVAIPGTCFEICRLTSLRRSIASVTLRRMGERRKGTKKQERKWVKPAYKDTRLGFEYTLYAMTR
jgi:coenzyme PQQ precursor peptide PqqA